jgi:hypothetical protein
VQQYHTTTDGRSTQSTGGLSHISGFVICDQDGFRGSLHLPTNGNQMTPLFASDHRAFPRPPARAPGGRKPRCRRHCPHFLLLLPLSTAQITLLWMCVTMCLLQPSPVLSLPLLLLQRPHTPLLAPPRCTPSHHSSAPGMWISTHAFVFVRRSVIVCTGEWCQSRITVRSIGASKKHSASDIRANVVAAGQPF